MTYTADALRAFTADVARVFNEGRVRAPVHLSGGNEEELIRIFRDIDPEDWVCTTWRSHYHCLLKGVPPGKLMGDIVGGKSIALCYPEYRVLSSAIVGGSLPIALGLALSAKRAGSEGASERVWAFCGDMAAMGGTFHECTKYALGHDLPIRFVVENNGKSVCTDTMSAWGDHSINMLLYPNTDVYDYELPWPHAGAGKQVQF